jgi:sugar lactone lactonase YvrE
MRLLLACLVLIAIALAYLFFWPVAVEPVAWQAPPAPGYVGPHAVNTRLAQLSELPLDGDSGPEHVVVRVDDAGQTWIYLALASGAIVRIKPDGSARELVVRTGGRPLGFDFDRDGALIVADPMWGAHGGLLRVTGRGADAKIELLTDFVDHPVPGDPIRYADAVVVTANGRIYFSDASRRFGAKAWGGTFNASVLDILEHQNTGRLLEYDPATRRTRVLLSDLSFANGVALSKDEQHVFIAETGEYRIWKVAVGANALSAKTLSTRPISASSVAEQPIADAQVLLDNLPGYPDNLMRGLDGRLWVGFTKPRGAFIDDNAARPWVRALALRLPSSMWPVPPAYGHVFAFDESGRVLADLQDPSGAYPEATSVTETADRLYIQSLHAKSLGWRTKQGLGLTAR